jgi:hypothetical protein
MNLSTAGASPATLAPTTPVVIDMEPIRINRPELYDEQLQTAQDWATELGDDLLTDPQFAHARPTVHVVDMVALGIGPQNSLVVVVTGVISFADADVAPQAAAISQSLTIVFPAPQGCTTVDPMVVIAAATWASGAYIPSLEEAHSRLKAIHDNLGPLSAGALHDEARINRYIASLMSPMLSFN